MGTCRRGRIVRGGVVDVVSEAVEVRVEVGELAHRRGRDVDAVGPQGLSFSLRFLGFVLFSDDVLQRVVLSLANDVDSIGDDVVSSMRSNVRHQVLAPAPLHSQPQCHGICGVWAKVDEFL